MVYIDNDFTEMESSNISRSNGSDYQEVRLKTSFIAKFRTLFCLSHYYHRQRLIRLLPIFSRLCWLCWLLRQCSLFVIWFFLASRGLYISSVNRLHKVKNVTIPLRSFGVDVSCLVPLTGQFWYLVGESTKGGTVKY